MYNRDDLPNTHFLTDDGPASLYLTAPSYKRAKICACPEGPPLNFTCPCGVYRNRTREVFGLHATHFCFTCGNAVAPALDVARFYGAPARELGIRSPKRASHRM